jgi:hypothetical protein
MSNLFNFFPFSWLQATRRNHALEHATLQILARKHPGLRGGGYSDGRGFWILGDLRTEDVLEAAEEALARLKAGERHLAIHPNCGTNFALSGLAGGTAAWLAMLPGTPRGLRQKFDRLPWIIFLTTLALILARPLGPLAQAYLTTDSDLGDLRIQEVVRYPRKDIRLHRVRTI